MIGFKEYFEQFERDNYLQGYQKAVSSIANIILEMSYHAKSKSIKRAYNNLYKQVKGLKT